MSVVILILLVAAFVCFVLAALGVGAGRVSLLALGLALWVLTALIPAIAAG